MKNIKGLIQSYWPDVIKVIDAGRDLEIEVLPKDVRGADPKQPGNCAFARACKRALSVDAALISPTVAYIKRGATAVRYHVPPSVQREIVTFDRHADFAPGEYRLTPHAPTRLLGAQPKGRPYSPKKNWSGRRKRPTHHTVGLRDPLRVQGEP